MIKKKAESNDEEIFLKEYCNYALEKGVFNDLGYGNNLENFVSSIFFCFSDIKKLT